MYDKKNDISGEDPEHMEFVHNIAIPLFQSWGYKVKILRASTDYLDNFYSIVKNPRKHKEHEGMYRGFATTGLCSIKRDCKLKPITEFYSSIKDDYTQYVGIAMDEPSRLESMHNDCSKVSLLEKYHLSEYDARMLCDEYGLLSPIYKQTNRNGCWFCPNAKLCEHQKIKEKYPDVWNSFIALEDINNLANNKWNVYGETLHDRDKRLDWEIHYDMKAEQISLFN